MSHNNLLTAAVLQSTFDACQDYSLLGVSAVRLDAPPGMTSDSPVFLFFGLVSGSLKIPLPFLTCLELQVQSAIALKTSHTKRLDCSCWRQQEKFVGAVKLADKDSSHPSHIQFGLVPSRLLRMHQLRHCGPCLGDCDMAFSQMLSIENDSRPMQRAEPSNSSAHDQVRLLFCVTKRRLPEILAAVPELSNLFILHENMWQLKSTWLPGHISTLPCRDPTCRCSFENSVSHNRSGHPYCLPQQAKIDPCIIESVGCRRVVELNYNNVLCVHQLFRVS